MKTKAEGPSNDVELTVMSNKRLRGHAETPYIIGCGSVILGLLWATPLVARHGEYAFYLKALIFIISPLVGLLIFAVILAFLLAAGFTGEWMDSQIARWRQTRKNRNPD